MIYLHSVFRLKGDKFVTRRIGGETIIVPLVSNVADMTSVLTLNEIATTVFDAINGKNSVNDILTKLIDEYDVESAVLENDIINFINVALEKQLIEHVNT